MVREVYLECFCQDGPQFAGGADGMFFCCSFFPMYGQFVVSQAVSSFFEWFGDEQVFDKMGVGMVAQEPAV